MHPLVRDLYKRVLLVGHDYPHPQGLSYVKQTWKKALRNPENCPSCYYNSQDDAVPTKISNSSSNLSSPSSCEKEIHKAVARGRYMVREMIGVIQLKKYRTLKKRYDTSTDNDNGQLLNQAMKELEEKNHRTTTQSGVKL